MRLSEFRTGQPLSKAVESARSYVQNEKMRKTGRGGTLGERGQVAIFVALIFQVLFVFFTMVVNVGLLVHHKINLQNSVDLAAYYGAMKQAETMNALAHVNYQLRQAWKLMTFRYRQIGMAGDDSVHPYDFKNRTLRGNARIDEMLKGKNGQTCPTTFCIAFAPIKGMSESENYCRDICETQNITLLGRPESAGAIAGIMQGGFPNLARLVDNISRQLTSNSEKTCEQAVTLTWFSIARFIWGYKADMMARKKVFNKLANSISYTTDDFKDIDGESARRGAYQTFYKNLSFPNQESFEADGLPRQTGAFGFFNALGSAACGGTEGEEKIPPQWAREVFIKPVYSFRNGTCNDPTQTRLSYFSAEVNKGGQIFTPQVLQSANLVDPALLNFLKDAIVDPDDLGSAAVRLAHSTIGYEKNPWCMAYVGVQASSTPRIPFTPFNNIKLTARGFAKPFGGRMGPWYYKNWPAGSQQSRGSSDDKIDKMLPPRFEPGASAAGSIDESLRGDFSRYVGDAVGTKSTITMGQFGQAIHRRYPAKDSLDALIWNDLLGPASDVSQISSHGDSLANANGAAVPMRYLELAAVIPDNFDVTYYSIEPDFWRNYAIKLQKRPDFANVHVRGDLGYRKGGDAQMATMTIMEQLRAVYTNVVAGDQALDLRGLLSYTAGMHDSRNGFTETLTSWHLNESRQYRLDDERFGRCATSGVIPDGIAAAPQATSGNCAAGGRTGYSVKLVDGEFLKSDQPLGGSATGQIINPWSDADIK